MPLVSWEPELEELRRREALARAVELSLKTVDEGDLSPLGNDVDSLVGELESLRQGLEEAGGGPTGTGTATAT